MAELTRREMITVAAGTTLSASLIGGCALGKGRLKTHANDEFYNADGTLNEEKAKAAYYAMMDYYNYPIPDRLKGKDFWTLDFGLGCFTEVGMAGIFWINNQAHNYMGHEIYLLPGQMIPEHWHVKTEEAEAKLEGWHVRHGSVTLYAEGEPTPGSTERIPPSHRKIAKARTEQVVMPGEVGYLANPCERHFQVAGPEGAIVTEYATYHDMKGLRFTHPGISL